MKSVHSTNVDSSNEKLFLVSSSENTRNCINHDFETVVPSYLEKTCIQWRIWDVFPDGINRKKNLGELFEKSRIKARFLLKKILKKIWRGLKSDSPPPSKCATAYI